MTTCADCGTTLDDTDRTSVDGIILCRTCHHSALVDTWKPINLARRVTKERQMIAWKITAPKFVADIDELDGRVNNAPPAISWAIGRDIEWMCHYASRKGWRMQIVAPRRKGTSANAPERAVVGN